jgi:hypothetical protein
MSGGTLHEMPRWRDVLLEQIRITGLSLRPVGLIIAVVLGVGTFQIGAEILGGGPGFDSRERFPTALIAFLYPFAVWRGDRPFSPAFFWTVPVDRRRLALAKVLAGGVWLMAAVAFFAAWLVTLASIGDASPAQQVARIPFHATIVTYLIGSAIVLGLRYSVRWLLGAFGVLFMMGRLSDLLSHPDDREWRRVPGADGFFSAVQDAWAVWYTLPELTRSAIGFLLFLSLGLALLWAAVSRHRETRRH